MRASFDNTRRRSRRLWSPGAAALAVGVLLASIVTWRASTAAFLATTGDGGDTWGTGAVVLTDDDAGTALFSVSGLVPGNTGTNCILVTYAGSIASTVELYVSAYAGTLGPYLNLTIATGSGATCAAFGTVTSIFSGTLDSLRTNATGFASGAPASNPWSPSSAGTVRPYRFTYTLADDNTAAGRSATVDFTWEAQNL